MSNYQFGPQDEKFSDVILVMTEAHKAWIAGHVPDAAAKTFTLGQYATGTPTEILDAFGKPMDFYQSKLAQLDGLVGVAVTKAAAKP